MKRKLLLSLLLIIGFGLTNVSYGVCNGICNGHTRPTNEGAPPAEAEGFAVGPIVAALNAIVIPAHNPTPVLRQKLCYIILGTTIVLAFFGSMYFSRDDF